MPPSGGDATARRRKLLCLAAVLALVAATFLPVLGNGFTSWDDDVYLTGNRLVRDLSPGGVGRIFLTPVSGNYHPLVFLVHAVEFRLFGLDPRAYHATSLALHLLATALAFEALCLLCGALPGAMAGALLWALHPMRVETVAWVADRKDLLAAVFFLGALVLYLRAGRCGRPRPGAGVHALFLLALLAKGTAVTVPIALLLVDFVQGRFDRRAVAEKVPLLALSLVFGGGAVLARASYQGVLEEGVYGGLQVLSLAAHRLVWHYLPRTLLPVTGLFPLYPTLEATTGPTLLRLLPAAGVIAALAAAAWLTLRRTRKVVFGALFFLAVLLPSLFVTVLGFSADRFTYVPAVGLACLAGAGAQRLWEGAAGPVRRGALAAVLAAVCGALAALSWRQCAVWRDGLSLWTHAVASYPARPEYALNRALAHYYRGLDHERRGEVDRARADLDEALRLVPGKAEFLAARGQLRAGRGDLAGMREDLAAARDAFSAAIGRGGGGARALLERGKVRAALGEREGAVADFTEALRLDPGNAAAWNARGIAHTEAGAAALAAADFSQALRIEPDNAVIHLNAGILHLNGGNAGAALPEFERTLELDPLSAVGHMGRARALAALGEPSRALADLERAEALGHPPDAAFRQRLAQRLGQWRPQGAPPPEAP